MAQSPQETDQKMRLVGMGAGRGCRRLYPVGVLECTMTVVKECRCPDAIKGRRAAWHLSAASESANPTDLASV